MGQSYRELIAWQKAMDFVMDVYKVTGAFPKEKQYGLGVQMRRAMIAVPSNIAQGQARYASGEFYQYVGRARGALVEVETQLVIAQNLKYIISERAEQLLTKAAELGKILNGLAHAIPPAA